MAYHIENRKYAFTVSESYGLLPEPHIHPHLEIIYLTQGKSAVCLDNTEYTIGGGDFFIAFPNQIHYYHDIEPVKGYMIIFTPELFEELREIFHSKVPKCPIIHREHLPENIENEMKKMFQKRNEENMFGEITARGHLLALLGEIIPVMELREHERNQDTIMRILTYCIERYKEPVTLEMMAKDLYLNKYYISHMFRERMNISYKDFINKLRVEHACTLLEKGVSITEVAYASGFSTVRTFNRAFGRHMGMAPREYMRERRYVD